MDPKVETREDREETVEEVMERIGKKRQELWEMAKAPGRRTFETPKYLFAGKGGGGLMSIMAGIEYCGDHPGEKNPCEVCIREAAERDVALRREVRQRREEQARRLFEHPEDRMKASGVRKRYLPCSLDNFEGGERYVRVARECAANPSDLVFCGGPGSGKTHLACGIVRDVVRRGGEAHFVTASNLLLEIRDTFTGNSGKREKEIVSKYVEMPLLVLDDLGAEKTTEWSITTLLLIIDGRYSNCRPTIVTTNLSLDEIDKHVSPRIASRLAGMTIGEVKMPDYRRKRNGARS
jgi:DNA replication protein DnaC